MNLGQFTYIKDVGHYEEKEELAYQGTSYEHKSKSRTWVKTGTQEITIEVTIDPQAVANAVSGAIHNKSGTAKYLHGAVIGRVINRGKTEDK